MSPHSLSRNCSEIKILIYYKIHETVTKQSNIKIKQYYCIKKRLKSSLLSKRNNLAELMFLFKIDLFRLISKISLISRTNLLSPFVKMVNSSKDAMLFQFKRWSRIRLSSDGLVFLNVKCDIPTCSLDLTFKCLSASL